jgi:hypothetical protein
VIFSFNNSSSHLSRWLLRKSYSYSSNQGDIAALVRATHKHTHKILVSYKKRGYLSTNQNYHFTLHNPRALAQRC